MTNLDTAISLDVIVSATAGFIAVVGVYIRLKSKIDILETTCKNQEKEIILLHKEDKEMSDKFFSLQKEVSQGHNKLETSMAQMELRIIRELQSAVAQIINQKDN
jgi:hypothetical protein